MNGAAGYALALGDDALVLAQRCAGWVTNAPQLEEDVALANIGLDLLGQARALLTRAGELEGAGRDEDALAYRRDPADFRNVRLVELEGDFALSTARLLLFSTYQLELYRTLVGSRDPVLAAIAGKAVKEVAYHRDHAASWVVRLGDGTPLSHGRMQAGLDAAWPFAGQLFDGTWLRDDESVEHDGDLVADGIAADPAALLPAWRTSVGGVLAQATLEVPAAVWPRGGGRDEHTPALAPLLETLQALHRAHPGASW